MFIYPIGHKSFQSTDRYRGVELPAVAVLFTGMIADPPHRRRERIILFDHLEGLLIAARLNKRNIALGACLRRAGALAGARSLRGYQEGIWNSLRVGTINSFSLIQSLIKLIWQNDGTDLCAVIATRTFPNIDISRPLPDLGLKMPGFSLERNQIGTRDDFDITMAACLDEFWREDAHRAVVGWKSLVQLGHHPTNGRRGLKEVNIVAG